MQKSYNPWKKQWNRLYYKNPKFIHLICLLLSLQQKRNYQMNITSAWKYTFLHNNSNISRKKVFWDNPDQDKWFNISPIMVQQTNRWIHYAWARIDRFRCCTMTRVILTFDLDPGNPKGTYINFNAGSILCITFMPSFFNVVLKKN